METVSKFVEVTAEKFMEAGDAFEAAVTGE